MSRIPAKLSLPKVKEKMSQIINQYDFQVFLNNTCNDILEYDALDLLRRLNQGQRRAIKVSPLQQRCRVCTCPLYLPPGAIPTDPGFVRLVKSLKSELSEVCGLSTATDSGVIIFSNFASFHQHCFHAVFFGDNENQNCLVCQEAFCTKVNTYLPTCGHRLCLTCKAHSELSRCPVCKEDYPT